MKIRTTLFAIAAALILLATVPFVFAQDSMMMLGHLDHAKQALGLSDQQVSDLQAIFQQTHEQNAAYRQQVRGGMHQVMQTLLKNPNDLAGAQALLDQQTEAERAMKSNLLAAASKALNVLNADQRARFSDLLEQRMAKQKQQK